MTTTKGCCEYTGTISSKGYGVLTLGGRQYKAHRLAVLLSGRTIPKGKVIDHLCRNMHCINPNHLEVVSNVENVMRGVSFGPRNKSATHCIKGLSFKEHGKLTVARKGTAKGVGTWRKCGLCHREAARLRYQRLAKTKKS